MFSAVELININLSFAPQTTSKSQYSFAHLIFKMIKIVGFFFFAQLLHIRPFVYL